MIASSAASAEVLCIGTELLLGNITNSNARWIAEQLATLGISHHRQQVVGDNRQRLITAVREAACRSRVLITTGGLGPTPDDLTTEALAAAFDTPLQEWPGLWQQIQDQLTARGRPCSPSNRKQALLPKGAELIPNPTGTAPGMLWSPRPGFTLLTFPGVPSEMRAMWFASAAPWLCQAGLRQGVFTSRSLRFWGVPESTLADQVDDLLHQANPTVAPYAGGGEVKLRLTAQAATDTEAQQLLQPLEAEIRRRLGLACFGVDDASLPLVVMEMLRHHRQTLAVAESCTGGGLGASLSALPGASDVFLGGVIAYANRVKCELLGVPEALLEAHGAVSDPVAAAMATGARQAIGADWALAVTGVAGPAGGSAEKPVGLVHIAVAGPQGVRTAPVHFNASRGRNWIQALAAGEALNRLRLQLLEPPAHGVVKGRPRVDDP